VEVSLRARQHQRNAEIERKQRHGSQFCYVIDWQTSSRWRQIGFVSGDVSGYAKEAAKIQTDNEGNISFLLKSSRIPLNAGNTLWPIATTMVTRNPTVRAWREPPPNAAVRIGLRHVNTEGGRNKKPDIGGAHGIGKEAETPRAFAGSCDRWKTLRAIEVLYQLRRDRLQEGARIQGTHQL